MPRRVFTVFVCEALISQPILMIFFFMFLIKFFIVIFQQIFNGSYCGDKMGPYQNFVRDFFFRLVMKFSACVFQMDFELVLMVSVITFFIFFTTNKCTATDFNRIL